MPKRREVRCASCGRLLLKTVPSPQNDMEIKCPKCRAVVKVLGLQIQTDAPEALTV